MGQISGDQSNHEQFESHNHHFKITILCDQLTGPANIGAVLRLADAYGVTNVIFVGGLDSITPRVKSVARGCEKIVNHSFVNSFDLGDEHLWVALEITQNSQPFSSLILPQNKQLGIIIGNERDGVSDHYLQKCAAHHIKMFGNNSSMNVANALSAALFSVTQ